MMLELNNIKKDYLTGGEIVHALKGVSIKFRKSEFVSILGPSGCGKTTLLNIIGGLDKYSEGDLIINGKSTKKFKARDWDTYRNHSVGFVFQSYNLIPHQTVLQNVELALTLSGVSNGKRKKKAIEALKKVGLGDQLRKKPSQLSGGQMQRVAIARAIVNDPDIVLADEPTGALDTQTSIQVMDILKEISKDRLVIMVTHNPDIANKYSTRIIKILDGELTHDTNYLTDEELNASKEQEPQVNKKQKKVKKPSMSLFTSFGLSLKNLFTKKGRTALTSFAGSIGIIGIALIYAVSQGTTAYIDIVQEETLSSYPLTLEAQSMDLTSLMQTFAGAAQSAEKHDNDAVYQKSMVYDMINALNDAEAIENDLKSFKKYLENELKKDKKESKLPEAVSGVQYTYDFDMLVYTKNVDGSIILSDSQKLMQELLAEHLGMDLSAFIGMGESGGMMGTISSLSTSGAVNLWQEMLKGDNGKLISPVLEKQYDVIYGSWPTDYNEIVLVLDENNELDDITLYALGLKTKEEIDAVMKAAKNEANIEVETRKWSYEEICDMQFRTVLNSKCFVLDEKTKLYTDLRNSTAGLKYLYDNGIDLKVTGIIKPKEDVIAGMLTGSIGYTSKLTEYIIENSKKSDAVKAQLDEKTKDIFTGLPFEENTGDLTKEQKQTEFKKYIYGLDEKGKGEAYIKIKSIPDKQRVDAYVNAVIGSMTKADMENALAAGLKQQTGMKEEEIKKYLSSMEENELKDLIKQSVEEQYEAQYAAQITAQLSALAPAQLAVTLEMEMANYTLEQCAAYYDEVLTFSESSYEDNLRELGYVDLDDPATINLFAASFDDKDIIKETITDYNDKVDELSEITYTDYVGLLMSSVTIIIDAITYVLIAFVAVSLIVSSIMIGVITLISVQERTKEIGILRAIGASKRNVSSMFNAETVIIGLISGLLGVGVTYLLCIPINKILHVVTGIGNLNAILPIEVAIILVIISVVLTLLAGIIPSRSAAKKDPVVALRTE